MSAVEGARAALRDGEKRRRKAWRFRRSLSSRSSVTPSTALARGPPPPRRGGGWLRLSRTGEGELPSDRPDRVQDRFRRARRFELRLAGRARSRAPRRGSPNRPRSPASTAARRPPWSGRRCRSGSAACAGGCGSRAARRRRPGSCRSTARGSSGAPWRRTPAPRSSASRCPGRRRPRPGRDRAPD